MIPKKIHYIWLGKGNLPQIFEKCLKSWQKFCPDFEIKRWDESNLNLDLNQYVRQAYDSKKYAFASDVFRFEILFKEGGIYLDVDVELLKPIDDLLNNKCFLGYEEKDVLNPGCIIGAEAGNKDIKNLLDSYSNEKFIDENGKMDLTTICTRTTDYYKNLGLKCDGTIEKISQSTLFPQEYFNPTDINTQKRKITKNTYSIHHFNASWYDKNLKFKRGVKTFLNKISFGLFGKMLKNYKNKKKNREHKWKS